MNKITLIAKREFLTRVKKKTFLLTTIGLPLLISGIYALIIFFTVKSTSTLKIAVADNANVFNNSLFDTAKGKKEIEYVKVDNQTKASLEEALKKESYDAYIYVPNNYTFSTKTDSIQVVSSKSIGIMSQTSIERRISNRLEERKVVSGLKISKAQLDSLQTPTEVVFKLAETKDKKANIKEADESTKSGMSYGIGMFCGVLIYITLFIYGTMVMRGVMEEKTNRIAEVIVSSVKPFQLMMGKILGIGSVGLLQFLIWIVLVSIMNVVGGLFMAKGMAQPGMQEATAAIQETGALGKFSDALSTLNIPLIIGCFLFYFLGGYFMYASLFAAVGSTVNEDPQDAQSLTLPITMPIIFAFVIMMQAVNDPHSGLAVFGSLFPLTSPIVMMARIAHGVPDGVSAWELILSMVLLIVGFIGTTWLAGKIYRTGILMYGKKVTLKELAKWAFRKS